jgi:hypothetical protein
MPRPETFPLSVKVWGLRLLVVASIVLVCMIVGSSAPAFALMLVWGPMGLIYVLFTRGALNLPRFLVPVKRVEPVLYHWFGVGLVKRVVTTRMWPMLNGFDPPKRLQAGTDALNRAELTTIGAEVCHGTLFILMLPVALYFLSAGQTPEAFWMLGLALVLHGYPVMLQRTNRWRIQDIRTRLNHVNRSGDGASIGEMPEVPPSSSLEQSRDG